MRGLSKQDEFYTVSARLGIGKSWVTRNAKHMVNGYKVGFTVVR